ncbi:hypothetical protein QL898_05600 [Psychrobacter sp. APC 3279]|uniref:hypothetical protein n=1 Tax=Psychrobacter sp. APC 3279 TaxID=3035189 RepID=UPI0025B58FBF|nr:hypothetical protein [Psychrobacter sp. APC 3279]MDN3441099.1 hypothetical protein [Psychrobacter sp. APC 3279]
MTTPETKIVRSDLQFFPSERLTDNDDGGGMPLGTPISGEANELFNPISSIARVNGGFYARLVYAGVQRADDEPLIGAFAAITKPPSDPTVSYLMFPATKFGELRHEILERIEAFNVASIESRMTLLSTQTKRSKLVQAYQRVGEPLPLVGDIYCITQDKAGYPYREQYIQVARVTSEDRTFTKQSSGSAQGFTVTVVKIETSQALQDDFVGVSYPGQGYIDTPAKLKEVSVADAAQYYGVQPVAAPVLKDRQTIKVKSLMERIVPTNVTESFLTNLNAAGQRQTLFDGSKPSANGVVNLTVNRQHKGGSTSIYLGNAAVPGSIRIDGSTGEITDRGNDLILADVTVGTINAAAGELLINSANLNSYIRSVSFRPAGSELQIADTRREAVTINNRSNIWSTNINPPPAVGSLMASFRSQGKWYDLHDDGTGTLVGASAAHGSGSINFATGGAELTTGELPDVGSAIIWSWGTRARYFNRSDGIATAKMMLQLSQEAVPSTLSLSWVGKTAVCDALGNITGDWTGKYNPKTRQIHIDTGENFLHGNGAYDITVQYSTGVIKTSDITLSAPDVSGKVSFTAPSVLPGTVQVDYELPMPLSFGELDQNLMLKRDQKLTATVTDDAQGNLINQNGTVVGTISYTTGAGEFDPALMFKLPKAQIGAATETVLPTGGGLVFEFPTKTTFYVSGYTYSDELCTVRDDSTTPAKLLCFEDNSESAVTENIASGPIEINLLPDYSEIVMPSSVSFEWSGKRYFDKNGSIFTDLNNVTGAATLVGSIDYQTGVVSLRQWQWQTSAQPKLISLATSLTGNVVDSVTFRVPTAPIKPGSLTLRATALDGTLVSAKVALTGELTDAHVTGFVDTQFGLADAQFGDWVDAIGKESEPWYQADAITDDGQIWQPKLVFANTITYDAQGFTYLPINADVVNIDTVRLPQDGRIPIFRRGDTIIIGNRVTTDIGSAHTGGQTVTLPRNDVTRISVMDSDDKPVNAELWDYDLAAGSITWRTPLDLSMYKMPIKVAHAQEERNRIVDTDIDGTLSLQWSVRRDYAIADTYVSSVLIGGDLQVRVSIPFTQRSWDNVWRDEPKGDQLLNKLNLKDYPMILTDDGAIKERWMIKMTGTSTFELYGETLGFVMRGDTLTDLAPINPANGTPYFTLPKQAFGADAPWASQDIIRFNTWGTLLPIWVLCAVQPNPNPPTGTDGYTQCLYGDTTEIEV